MTRAGSAACCRRTNSALGARPAAGPGANHILRLDAGKFEGSSIAHEQSAFFVYQPRHLVMVIIDGLKLCLDLMERSICLL